jgi:hypothetical protein
MNIEISMKIEMRHLRYFVAVAEEASSAPISRSALVTATSVAWTW